MKNKKTNMLAKPTVGIAKQILLEITKQKGTKHLEEFLMLTSPNGTWLIEWPTLYTIPRRFQRTVS